jgi:hypothetical protein
MKYIPLDTNGGYNLSQINANFQEIADNLNDKVLYRDNPTGEANQMLDPLDMNSNRILNLPAPVNLNEPVRLQDLLAAEFGGSGVLPEIKASIVTVAPTGTIASTNVQDALVELDTDNQGQNTQITTLNSTVSSLSASVASLSSQVASLNLVKTVKDYGAVDDGVTDCTSAFQTAINSGIVIIPPTTLGFRINSPLNATNREGLYIKGYGSQSPSWGLAYELPVNKGSMVIMNTGGYFLDITGANNVTIEDVTFSSAFQINPSKCPNPSSVGIIGGTSSDNSRLGSPGGTNYYLKNVTVATAKSTISLPMIFNNINTCKFNNVATLGKWGVAITKNNPLGVTPPFTSFGTLSASDGNYISGLMCVGYGDQPVIYLENANDTTFDQTYVVYAGGAGTTPYPGPGYAIYIKDCTDVRMTVEEDFFPFMFRAEGALINVEVKGIACADPTGDGSGNPIVGHFAGTSYKQCKFNVTPIGGYPNGNFHYTSQGGAGSNIQFFNNCDFWFDTSNSPNAFFLNVNGANAIPFFNCNFRGTQDLTVNGSAFQLTRNGSALAASEYRIFQNGLRLGTA